MSTTSTKTFRIHALPDDVLRDVRTSGVDAQGRQAEPRVANGGEPLRCCLRDAEEGEELLLFGYQPPLPESPYREVGAVFAHVRQCEGLADDAAYPQDWRGRPQVLRAYDDRGWIHDKTTVHDGENPEAVIATMLADAGVVEIHSRNIAWGCYMFTIKRAS